MKFLIVYAHPEPMSFNGALLDAARSRLQALGHEVLVTDLYAEGFGACAGPGDFKERATEIYEYRAEMKHAAAGAGYVDQIAREQERLRWCDVLILQFPMWWFTVPAVLKGWFDRVMTNGFAYTPANRFDMGLLKGRRAMLSITCGGPESVYAPDGIDGDMMRLLWPLQNGLLRYVGFEVLQPFIAYSIGHIDHPGRLAVLDAFRERLARLETDVPIFFHPLSDFGPDRRLKPGIEARTGFQWNP